MSACVLYNTLLSEYKRFLRISPGSHDPALANPGRTLRADQFRIPHGLDSSGAGRYPRAGLLAGLAYGTAAVVMWLGGWTAQFLNALHGGLGR